ncbi:MAG: SCO family protein [Burkholderiaceae bacterium]
MKRMLTLLIAVLLVAEAGAGPLALPAPPVAGFTQNLDARLPLDARFIDENGAAVPLGRYFGAVPVVLVLGYYQCPNLCSTLMDGVLQTLAALRLPPQAFRLVEVGIDPAETFALAARKKVSFEPMLGRRGGELHLLTGDAAAIGRLARSAGFSYRYDPALRQYAHPAGFLVATPDGRIARYFIGVRFEPRDLRLALVEASAGRIGTLSDRLVLLCSHYDPASGRYSGAAMALVRAACLLALALLAGWIGAALWRGRTRRRP